MEPIKIEVAISVNVDLSQGTRDFVSQIVDKKIAASNESAERSLAILTQTLRMLQTPIPMPACGEMTPKVPMGPEGKPIATEAQIESDAMNEAARAEAAKKAEEAKKAAGAKKASEAEIGSQPSKEKQGTEKAINIEDVRTALTAKVNDHRGVIRDKLTALGAKSVTTLDPSKYQEMYDFLNSL